MKRSAVFALSVFSVVLAFLLPVVAQQPAAPPKQGGGRAQAPSVQPTVEERRQIQAKVEELDTLVKALRAQHANEDLVADVDVYAKAGRILLEFPEDFFTQDGINHTLTVLETGLERARQLKSGETPWMTSAKSTHGFYSALDGSVQPYGVTLPPSYDPSRPTRLYVWLHGRAARLTESDFLYSFPNQGPGRPPVADAGQIQLDVYGRWNGGGWHYAGEVDVFEAIQAVEKRYKIDPARVLLRGFSMGGEGAWHLAVHYPSRWAAAEIGAGTWSRRAQMPGLTDYQQATLRIWENYTEWALNFFNLPLAGHDGDADTQVSSLPPPPPGTPSRGQLESSIKVREQLEKEGFPSVGEPNDYSAKGTPAIFLISKQTGHGTSPEVRQRLDVFLKEYGDRGLVSPDHIRFLTYTTRYNQDYWVTLDQLEKHYERAEVDVQRNDSRKQYHITTKNLARLTLRETEHAEEIQIDGKDLRVKGGPLVALEKSPSGWQVSRLMKVATLHKVHGLQGPIDDAFLDPFLLVRPTGTAWNEAVNQQALRTLARFDRLYAKWFRAHPRIRDDKDVTAEDFTHYNVVLFGDPGSNRWIARINGRLPVTWTRDTVSMGEQKYQAADHFPALVYPNPLSPSHYVVLNTGLTIDEREYRGDYGMPRLGDYAVLKVKDGSEVGDVATAGLFNESWK